MPDGSAPPGPPLTDVVGELVEASETDVRVATRSGIVSIPRTNILVAKQVEASRAAILRLERVAADGWRPREVIEQDGWLLRADTGWTGRANSAIPLRSNDRPLDDQLAMITAFYRDRGLTPIISVPLPARERLDAELARRGWTARTPVVVMTRPLEARAQAGTDPRATEHRTVSLLEAPSPQWLAAYHYQGLTLPSGAVDVLTRHDCVRFAQLSVGDEVVAVARGAVDRNWLGITAVEVAADHRRRGYATQLLDALTTWAGTEDATHCYLQTEQTNLAAISTYARAGFIEHHRYQYRVAAAP